MNRSWGKEFDTLQNLLEKSRYSKKREKQFLQQPNGSVVRWKTG